MGDVAELFTPDYTAVFGATDREGLVGPTDLVVHDGLRS
jgi:acyl-CoA synthetase (NDP forming)